MPEVPTLCLCGHQIAEQCYLCPNDSTDVNLLVLGQVLRLLVLCRKQAKRAFWRAKRATRAKRAGEAERARGSKLHTRHTNNLHSKQALKLHTLTKTC